MIDWDALAVICSPVSNALSAAEQALLGGNEDGLYEALRAQALGLKNLNSQNKGWYFKELMAARELKEQVRRRD